MKQYNGPTRQRPENDQRYWRPEITRCPENKHHSDLLHKLSWRVLGGLVALVMSLCLFGCSLPILQIVNPTYTVQISTGPHEIINVKIPVELPDFVTGGMCWKFKVSEDIYGLKFRGVTKDTHGHVTDYYILVIKQGKPSRALALRAVQMGVDKFWVYIKGEPVPASMGQVKEKIDSLIDLKI